MADPLANLTASYGSRHTPCVITEALREQHWVCYQDYGIWYDVYWWSFLLGFTSVFCWSIYCTIIVYNAKVSGKSKRDARGASSAGGYCVSLCNAMSPSFMCLIFNDIACLLRIAWIANVYNGPASDGYIISPGFTRATLKLGQALMFSEVFLIVISWAAFVDSISKLKAVNDAHQNRLKLQAIFFSFMLLGVSWPLELYSIVNNDYRFVAYGEYFQSVVLLLLVLGGIYYSCKLAGILSGGSMSQNKIDSLKNIRTTSTVFTVVGLQCLISFICYTLPVYKDPLSFMLGFKLPIHGGEMIFLILLAKTASYQERRAFNASKSNASSLALNTSQTGSTTMKDSLKETRDSSRPVSEVSLSVVNEETRRHMIGGPNPDTYV